MEKFNEVLVAIDDFVWGPPLMILIMLGGILLTVRLGLLQVRKLPLALKWMVKNEDDGVGEVSSFAALCTALSATIGTGNIVGVATAICTGGPGALFWMVMAAFFGMATKYAEGLLAVKYRVVAEDGHSLGGPFYYIEKGMGKNWKWLAYMFAFFGVCAGLLGIGTFTQVNGISSAVKGFFDPDGKATVDIPLLGEYSWAVVISSFERCPHPTGISSENAIPSSVLYALMSPWWRMASIFVRCRPTPEPIFASCTSVWKNLSNILSRWRSSMLLPVFSMTNSTYSLIAGSSAPLFFLMSLTWIEIDPFSGVCLNAFDSMLKMILSKLPWSIHRFVTSFAGVIEKWMSLLTARLSNDFMMSLMK